MKIKSSRHGSRSTSKGKIVKSCRCGGAIKIILSDHYNLVAVCEICGSMREEHSMPGGISLFMMDKGRR